MCCEAIETANSTLDLRETSHHEFAIIMQVVCIQQKPVDHFKLLEAGVLSPLPKRGQQKSSSSASKILHEFALGY